MRRVEKRERGRGVGFEEVKDINKFVEECFYAYHFYSHELLKFIMCNTVQERVWDGPSFRLAIGSW